MDALPIPRLVDLLYALNVVVVEQSKMRLGKFLSDSFLFWLLLKVLFKNLHMILRFTSRTVAL